MVPAMVLDRSVFVRELLPQDLKVELDHISTEDGRAVAYYLGMVVGRAPGRQLDLASRRAWHREISTHRLKSIDAPSWLWTSLVELVAVHEHAYLEHCRRYARATEATLSAPGAQIAPQLPPPIAADGEPAFTASVASAAGAADAADAVDEGALRG